MVIVSSPLRGKTAPEAADDIIHSHLPKLQELGRDGEIRVDNIDVFCEKGVFDREATRRILQSGKDAGLQINFHGDELYPMKAAEVRLTPGSCSGNSSSFRGRSGLRKRRRVRRCVCTVFGLVPLSLGVPDFLPIIYFYHLLPLTLAEGEPV